ncbi:MAG: ComF family protein [Pseudomonadota bacterium]|nr:ComF family protein [Pseudomonadota bacterium]
MPDPVNRNTALPVDGWRRWRPSLPWRPRCLGCGEPGQAAQDLCPDCRAQLPWSRPAARPAAPPLQSVLVPFVYAPPLDHWLPRFKFHRDLAAGRLLSQLMLEACAAADRPEALLPIPLHRARLRQRGYDQALELAWPIARALRIPLHPGLLQRARNTAPQSRQLHASERHHNLRGAFVATTDTTMPAHVALVDDVMTTGATLHAAADALHRAGVQRVDAWVCAYVP